ncbi:hypothetical protein [Streptomyces sp. NPDC002346]
MRHVPFFRWVLALGLVLIACSVGLYMAAPGYPELRQVDLTVLDEKPDGACTVRWTDPFEHREREEPYLCDAERDPILKAPNYEPISGHGWDTGFVVAEGSDKGELHSLDEEGEGTDGRIELSDTLVAVGLLLTVIGVVGGNIRSLFRVIGVNPEVIRRARRLSEAAALVAQDHRRAVETVRKAWVPLHQELVNEELDRIPVARLQDVAGRRLPTEELEKGGVRTVHDVLDAGVWSLGQVPGVGRRTAAKAVAAARRTADDVGEIVAVGMDADRPEPRTTALVVALRVLVEAWPRVRNVAEAGLELAARLEPLLTDAAPASGWKQMLDAGQEQRWRARVAVAELRLLLDKAERQSITQQFAQTSVDLLRGPDNDPAGLSAWVDFETRSAEYYSVLTEVTDHSLSSAG